jgi:hypothetical protein
MRRLILAILLTAGCDDGFADVAGEYTVAVTNGDNGCMFMGWTVGNTATAIPLTISQTDEHVTGEVGGVAGGYLDLVLGTRIFTGSVSGNDVTMLLDGTTMAMQGTCDYSVDAVARARLAGDALMGSILYTADTDGSEDCGFLDTCQSEQNFSGSRPPPP